MTDAERYKAALHAVIVEVDAAIRTFTDMEKALNNIRRLALAVVKVKA